MSRNSDEKDLYRGLKQLSEGSFPKKCSNCGKVYKSAKDFIKGTKALPKDESIKIQMGSSGESIIRLFRNCTCGFVLNDGFSDRRDLSKAGRERRETFEKVLQILLRKGLPGDTARHVILKFMRDGEIKILKKYGVKIEKA